MLSMIMNDKLNSCKMDDADVSSTNCELLFDHLMLEKLLHMHVCHSGVL